MQMADMNAPGTMQRALEPTANPAWVVDAGGYNELRKATLESRFALSSGSLGVKGTGAFGRGAWSRSAAPVYRGAVRLGRHGARHSLELVQAAWLQIRILLPSGPLVHQPADASSHHIFARLETGSVDCRMLFVEGTGRGHPPAQFARRVAQRAHGWAAADPIGDRGRRGRAHIRSVVRGGQSRPG